jgi:phosphatidylglycerol lysyltransferase
MKRATEFFKWFTVRFVSLMTLGGGIVNLFSLIGPSLPERHKILIEVFSLEFIHLSKFLTLLIGFLLVISSINIYKKKKRAFQMVALLACLSIIFHLTKGLDYEEATVSLLLLIVLFLSRKNFTVKSSIPSIRLGVIRFLVALFLAMAYGVTGFWFLELHHFGINFHIGDAINETFKYLILVGDPQLLPQTHYAVWFLDSLYFMTIISALYAFYALFRPVIYQYRTYPHEQIMAKDIIEKHGRSTQDFFKYWPDKSYYFSPTHKSVIAYGVANNCAVVLGDPVGPDEDIEETIAGFANLCHENDWSLVFHQVIPDYLPIYEKLGYRKLKVGDDAIVDLQQFTIEKARKEMRHSVRKVEEQGILFKEYNPPIDDSVLDQLRKVSDEWLKIDGRRERRFTLGLFEPNYIKSTPVLAAVGSQDEIYGFLNIIPSYCKGEATNDLMRRKQNAPNGIMDFLFLKSFIHLKAQGYERFSLGMAPMAGFQENEQASPEEKAIHYFFQRTNFLFNYQGLRHYKAKFATIWEPRYAIYKNPLDLPKFALALRKLSEIKGRYEPSTSFWLGKSDT